MSNKLEESSFLSIKPRTDANGENEFVCTIADEVADEIYNDMNAICESMLTKVVDEKYILDVESFQQTLGYDDLLMDDVKASIGFDISVPLTNEQLRTLYVTICILDYAITVSNDVQSEVVDNHE